MRFRCATSALCYPTCPKTQMWYQSEGHPLGQWSTPSQWCCTCTNARIRLQELSPILTTFCHDLQISSIRPKYKCQEQQTGLVAWHNQRTEIWSLRHMLSMCNFFFLYISFYVFFDVPFAAMIVNFLTPLSDDTHGYEWWLFNVKLVVLPAS